MMDLRLSQAFLQHLPSRAAQELIMRAGASQLSAVPPFTESTLLALPMKCKRHVPF